MRRAAFNLASLLAAGTLTLGACGDGSGDAGSRAVAQVADDGTASSLPTVRLSPAFPRLRFHRPVFLTHAGDGTNRVFVVEQTGRVRVVENRSDAERAPIFLDIRPKVRTRHNEEGLLGLAFHPRYAENGTFLVYYTASSPRRGVLSRYRVARDAPDRADASSEEIVLEIPQPFGNHNGGTLLFGPDGYVYLGLGDGGAADDPHGHGQNLATLLGTIIRIDVDRRQPGRAYAIPEDNPFVGRAGARGEIWAYGLRNAWRMSFDRETGDLWAGDVGQNRWEEIDLITPGGNYGWNRREGAHDFRPDGANAGLIDPIVEYDRGQGLSVTGGHVYRGSRHPSLVGVYLYADYASGRLWALRYKGSVVTDHREVLNTRGLGHVSSFGEDEDGELYVCTFDRVDGDRGRVFRIAAD